MELVKGPNDSREEMLARMVAQYEITLLRTCYMYLRDRGMAEDATQETFLKAYKSLASFRGDCSEKSWLVRIAINTCRDMQRSAWFRYMDRRITPEDLPQAVIMPHDENNLDVMCDIMKLPPKLKEVIMLYYWQEMNVREIAQSLGIAQSTVSNRLKHARDKLHDVLERRYTHGRSQG